MKRTPKNKTQYPPGWNAKRIRDVIDYYDKQSDEKAAAEIESGFRHETLTTVIVPKKLVPAVKRLIARHKKRAG